MHNCTRMLIAIVALLPVTPACADIYKWEYINPADPNQGKQQSATLCPDGAGAYFFPNSDWSNRDLSMAYLIGKDLSRLVAQNTNLTAADLSQSNLQHAFIMGMNLTNANLSHANLAGAGLSSSNFTNANLSHINLTGGGLEGTFTGANLTGAVVHGAALSGISAAQLYSTSSYQAHDLTGIGFVGNNLSGWNFAGQNLTNARLHFATLSGANFTGAQLKGAYLATVTGFNAAQLYSTASYQAHDLSGITLAGFNMNGWNFSGQTLEGATFYDLNGANTLDSTNFHQANLANADMKYVYARSANFSQANLQNAKLQDALIYGSDFSGADVRGAQLQGTGMDHAQLYSTASYLAHDMTGVGLTGYFNLYGSVNLSGQNLTNASLNGDFRNANFSGANLTGANLATTFQITGAIFAGATIRNAKLPGAMTFGQVFSTASYQSHNLSGVDFYSMNLNNANFTDQDLTNASFVQASINGINLTGALVRGADFSGYSTVGQITPAQLYSTASYQAKNLTGIKLIRTNLAGANFADQNLTNAQFGLSNLTGASLAGAKVRGASFSRGHDGTQFTGGITLAQLYSTASYQARDLTGIVLQDNDLTGANLSQVNLTDAYLGAVLTNADLSGANIKGAKFPAVTESGFTANQLYSTASYQAHDLTGVYLGGNDLTGWNFADQKLVNARFSQATLVNTNFSHADLANVFFDYADITGADFSHANLVHAEINNTNTFGGVNFKHANLQNAFVYPTLYSVCEGIPWCNLEPLDFEGADTRGGLLEVYSETNPIDLTNTIRPNGTVPLLNLSAGRQLVVRNYHGDSSNYFGDDPLPIRVLQQFHASAGGTLELLFDADDWGSTISFAPSIPVTRGGTLELAFADGIDLTSQIGRTFDVFDWTDVAPSGTFSVSSPYVWDTSKLYITGEVTFLAAAGLPGDFNNDGTVNSSDFVVWRKGLGSVYTQAAYDVWRSHFGQTAGQGATLPSIPEPTSTLLLLPFAAIAIWRHRLHPPDRSSGSETHSN